jgi:hypothetical protein
MKLFAVVSLVAVLAMPIATSALAAPAAGTLVGTDGPGFTITLTQGGKKVTKLKAGTYTINVNDKSNVHNFHLSGPGVNKKTSVTALTKTVWKVTLKKGTYKFVCDPHATLMKGSFTVT